MSFIPTLIIDRNDLEVNRDAIFLMTEEARKKNKKGEGKWYNRAQGLGEILQYLQKDGIVFRDELIVIEQPDLSFVNKAVRQILDELKIYYTISN